MSNIEVRVQQHNSRSFMWIFPVVLAVAVGILAWGIFIMARHHEQQTILAAGSVSILAILAAWVLTSTLRAAAAQRSADLQNISAALDTKLQAITAILNQISEQQLISERAKAIAFRESERDALRRAIAEETTRKDWDAALVLAEQMETTFGYKLEADRVRTDIARLRETDLRTQVSEGMNAIDRYCRGEQWTLAVREAERLMAAFPDDALTQKLLQDVESRRQNLKRQLLEAWNQSVSNHDVDGAIETLKQLDMYLTPAEVQSLQDTARQIFKDKLMQLGQQFGAAMKNHNWSDALRLGEAIMNEFPNSRMAQEVRDKIALLRQRAAAPQPA